MVLPSSRLKLLGLAKGLPLLSFTLQTYWKPSESCVTRLLLLKPLLQAWCFWILRYRPSSFGPITLITLLCRCFREHCTHSWQIPNAIDSIPLSNPQLPYTLIWFRPFAAISSSTLWTPFDSISVPITAHGFYPTFLQETFLFSSGESHWPKIRPELSGTTSKWRPVGYAFCSLCSFYELHCSKTPDSAIAHLNREIKTIFGLLKWDDCRQIPGQGFQKILT